VVTSSVLSESASYSSRSYSTSLRLLVVPSSFLLAIVSSPIVSVAGGDFKLRIYTAALDDQTSEMVELSGHTDIVNAVSFDTLTGRTLASTGDDHTIRLWNADDAVRVPPSPPLPQISALRAHTHSRIVRSLSRDSQRFRTHASAFAPTAVQSLIFNVRRVCIWGCSLCIRTRQRRHPNDVGERAGAAECVAVACLQNHVWHILK
jgi:WD40 repeat protein